MSRRASYDPEPLYDKPHSVDLAQVLMVFEYFMLVSISVGIGPRLFNWIKGETANVPVLSDLEAAIDVGSSFPIPIVLAAIVVLTPPYVAVVLGLGHGRKVARAVAVVMVPVNTAIGIIAVIRTYGEVFALVVSPIWILMALCVIGGLASRTGRQWFRQGGWEPWYVRYEVDQFQQRRRPRPRRRRFRTAHDPNEADAD